MAPLNDIKAEEYASHIRELISQLKKTSKTALVENERYLVPPEIAKEKYSGRVGETFYLFPKEAPSQEIIDAYERVKPYYGTGDDAVSFEMHLSHRQMTVMFVDGDLVIRKDRNLIINNLTEHGLRETIQYAKENYVIDWDNAKIFIFPYKTMYFYISDSFEITLGGGRSDLRNPNNWFSIPFTEEINYKEIREMCREYSKQHPLEGDKPLEVSLNMDDVLKKVAEKRAQRESNNQSEEKQSVAPSQKSNNIGCLGVIAILLFPSVMCWLLL